MAKHDKAKQEKVERNLAYGNKYRQRKCKTCGHRSSRPGKCALCGGDMRAKRKESRGTT